MARTNTVGDAAFQLPARMNQSEFRGSLVPGSLLNIRVLSLDRTFEVVPFQKLLGQDTIAKGSERTMAKLHQMRVCLFAYSFLSQTAYLLPILYNPSNRSFPTTAMIAEKMFPTDPPTTARTIVLPNQQQFYPSDWPYDMPFHEGEVALQNQSGTHQSVMSYAPKVVRPYMPEQHREFYHDLPFFVAAARDANDNVWATLLLNHALIAAGNKQDLNSNNKDDTTLGAIGSPDPVTLQLPTKLVPGDALQSSAWGQRGMDVGLLGIYFSSARRNRVNGWIDTTTTATAAASGGTMSMHVTQSFGNCPQYIASRQWWSTTNGNDDDAPEDVIVGAGGSTIPTVDPNGATSIRSDALSSAQIRLLEQAETMFVATGYRGQGDDVRYGNDASHRGGPAGFINVAADSKTITFPEFKGNNHFNSLGNLVKDNRMGITIPLLESGGMLQLTGTAVVDMSTSRAAALYPGALRLVTFTVTQVNQVPDGTLPLRLGVPASQRARDYVVVAKVPESANITSFYFEPSLVVANTTDKNQEDLWDFTPGQHLPIRLVTPAGDMQRTYSLSAAPSAADKAGARYFRISVKREPQGRASSFLHDQVQVGDIVKARKPAGDFVLQDRKTAADKRTVVLLSTGIGVTPILSMLQHLVNSKDNRMVVWVHGARDGTLHAFRDEVEELVKQSPALVQRHIVYSLTRELDNGVYDSTGRIDAKLVQKLVPDLTQAEFYMCGPGAFMANVEEGLE